METEYQRELTCQLCGKKFVIFSKLQGRKLYCSDACRKKVEREKKRENNLKHKGEHKPKNIKRKTYTDPETGTVYYAKTSDAILVKIDRLCKAAGLSYGQYTSREYAPKCYGFYPEEKEKEYKPVIFKWKVQKKKKKTKPIIYAGKRETDTRLKTKHAGRPKGKHNRKRKAKYMSSSGSTLGFASAITDILKEETK